MRLDEVWSLVFGNETGVLEEFWEKGGKNHEQDGALEVEEKQQWLVTLSSGDHSSVRQQLCLFTLCLNPQHQEPCQAQSEG